jgi:hypothetical protein
LQEWSSRRNWGFIPCLWGQNWMKVILWIDCITVSPRLTRTPSLVLLEWSTRPCTMRSMWMRLVKDGGKYILAADKVDPTSVSGTQETYHQSNVPVCSCKTPIQLCNKIRVQWSHWDLSS